jgi:hypothetical protein
MRSCWNTDLKNLRNKQNNLNTERGLNRFASQNADCNRFLIALLKGM